MPFRIPLARLDRSWAVLRRALEYAFYDWTREMPKSKRVRVMTGTLLQGFALYAGVTRSLIWPVIWPKGIVLFPVLLLLYYLGHCLKNAMLTSEFH